MKIIFLNETKVFKWKQVSWMKIKFLNGITEIFENQIIESILKLLNKRKYRTKPKSLNELTIIESKTSYWINMLLLHKHSAIGYKTEITEWIKTVEWNC